MAKTFDGLRIDAIEDCDFSYQHRVAANRVDNHRVIAALGLPTLLRGATMPTRHVDHGSHGHPGLVRESPNVDYSPIDKDYRGVERRSHIIGLVSHGNGVRCTKTYTHQALLQYIIQYLTQTHCSSNAHHHEDCAVRTMWNLHHNS